GVVPNQRNDLHKASVTDRLSGRRVGHVVDATTIDELPSHRVYRTIRVAPKWQLLPSTDGIDDRVLHTIVPGHLDMGPPLEFSLPTSAHRQDCQLDTAPPHRHSVPQRHPEPQHSSTHLRGVDKGFCRTRS